MAVKRTSKGTTPQEGAAAVPPAGMKKPATSKAVRVKTPVATKPLQRVKKIADAVTGTLQTVGADVVPSQPIEVDVRNRSAKAKKEGAGSPDGKKPVERRKNERAPKKALAIKPKEALVQPPGFVNEAESGSVAQIAGLERAEARAERMVPTEHPGALAREAHATPVKPAKSAAKAATKDAGKDPAATNALKKRRAPANDEVPETGRNGMSGGHASSQSGETLPESTIAQHSQQIDPRAIVEHRVVAIEPEPTMNHDAPGHSLLSDWDIYLFNEGSHHKLWEKLGAHLLERDGVKGTNFAVWAPNAKYVSVVGEFNEWEPAANPLTLRAESGIWEGFIPAARKGMIYKFHIASQFNDYRVNKADPFGVLHEEAPSTGSIIWDLDYQWHDDEWMTKRRERNNLEAACSTYEVHLGSWRRVVNADGSTRSMTYREIAKPLAEYLVKMNFTHVEFLPLMEHPFYGSWGYQVTGFFAPSSRYGKPEDLKYLIDVLHQNGIAVILDWVPSHFPTDEHGLSYFDGTHLFEHADPRKGFHPDWGSLIFNYGRNEVRSFLLSSAIYWLGEYHADGLRVDAVASMLYLDYSRRAGEWIPNDFGGRENIEAISFLRRLNEDVYKVHPDTQVIAEESTAWPLVSRPTYAGGLGFGMKWDMGWMHDSLAYFSREPIHRRYHHNDLTFRMMYAFTENFVLPLSHDEVVHGKGSLVAKMPGDEWQKFANLRLLFAHMYSQPAKKLVFMGGEFGQWREWNHDASLEWEVLKFPLHAGMQRWMEDLNKAYRDVPAFHELDFSSDGFEWVDCCDNENSIISIMRRSKTRPDEVLVIALNFTPRPQHNYQLGVPRGGHWTEILNSDAPVYGGSGQGNMGGVDAAPVPLHGRKWSVNLTIPPLGAVFLLSEEAVALKPVADVAGIESASVETGESEIESVA